MTTFTPTAEQLTITTAATSTPDNLLITALAGAAKTTTLILIAEALPNLSILSLAFNKKIAVEMKERLPSNCTSKTLHSVGAVAWGNFIRKKLQIVDRKIGILLSSWIKEHVPLDENESFYEDEYDDLREMLNEVKLAGWYPNGFTPPFPAKRLLDDDEFILTLAQPPTETQWQALREITMASIQMGYEGKIDFDDMIYLPAIAPVSFPSYKLILIDEAQDLSNINHVLLRKIKGIARLIAVGDPNQAIYAFRGADENSMSKMEEMFNMKRYTLSTSFRCPKAVVRAARWRAPQMLFPEWAKEGSVTSLSKWDMTKLPHGTVIICRNNAPLFRMAIRLIKAGYWPELQGTNITGRLIKVMKSLGAPEMTSAELQLAINAWADVQLLAKKNSGRTEEMKECLLVFAEATSTLEEAVAKIEQLSSATGNTRLMTGHKAKGLEFDSVAILDKHLLKLEKEGQDRNLFYVMQTRAKDSLFYVQSTDFVE